MGIPTALERPNAHTGYAYRVVQEESARLGIELPADHEHAFNEDVLAKEEMEYELADGLLCPSEFTASTFRSAGYDDAKLLRHYYGVDTNLFYPADPPTGEFRAVFVGVAAVRKGLHFALEAWLRSPASESGRFLIAGEMLDEYRRVLDPWLSDSSVVVLGHSAAVPELLRNAHVLLLPSIEEGFGLVCTEAMASGCVPLVSDACTDVCVSGVNALVHHIGDIDMLSAQISLVFEDRVRWAALRKAGLEQSGAMTWDAAGKRLAEIYTEVVSAKSSRSTPALR